MPKIKDDVYQVTFFKEGQESQIIKLVESLDVNQMTPLEALNVLNNIKNIIRDEADGNE